MKFIDQMQDSKIELVGVCCSGPARGLYLRAVPLVSDDASAALWDFEFSGVIEADDVFPEDVVSLNINDLGDRAFIDALDVERAPEPWVSRARSSLFGSSITSALAPSDWSVTGRFWGPTALERRLSMLEQRLNLERAKAFSSGSTLNVKELRQAVLDQADTFASLSIILAASGLSLAIVPASVFVQHDEVEPWREFGDT